MEKGSKNSATKSKKEVAKIIEDREKLVKQQKPVKK